MGDQYRPMDEATKETEQIVCYKMDSNVKEKVFSSFSIVSRFPFKIKYVRVTNERVCINSLFFMYAKIIDFADVTIHGRMHEMWNGVKIHTHSQRARRALS